MAEIMTCGEAVNRTIVEEMRRDPTIFIWGYGPDSRAKEFGWERVGYGGISEHQWFGAGIGAALVGTRPIVNVIMSDFAVDAWGQLVLQAAKIRFKLAYKLDCPVVFNVGYGTIGGLSVHHSSCFHNWLANAPGLLVAVPSTPADTRGLWRTALREAKDPVVMSPQLPVLGIKGPVPEDDYTIPFGVADVKREGSDVTIAAVGYWVHVALEVAEDLAKEGIDTEVWDPRTLTPFDRESLIDSVRKTGAMVAVDQAPKTFGTTGEFFATVAEAITPVPPMARVATMDAPIGFSKPLEDYVLPNKDKLISAVKGVLKRKG